MMCWSAALTANAATATFKVPLPPAAPPLDKGKPVDCALESISKFPLFGHRAILGDCACKDGSGAKSNRLFLQTASCRQSGSILT